MAEEFIKLNEARVHFKIGRPKMKRLIESGTLPTYENPLDKREILIKKEDLEKLKQPVPRSKVQRGDK